MRLYMVLTNGLNTHPSFPFLTQGSTHNKPKPQGGHLQVSHATYIFECVIGKGLSETLSPLPS